MERTNRNNSNFNNQKWDHKRKTIQKLPLSWIFATKNVFLNYLNLGFSAYWIYSCKISNVSDLPNKFSQKPKANFIIRGCNKEISDYLSQFEFSSVIIGKEAIIDLHKNPFLKKSLKELVNRGLKFGTVEEIKYSASSIKKLEEFKSQSVHSKEPQLRYLFIDKFIPETRLFAFIDNNRIWQGAILISLNSPYKMQAELLLRKKTAPNGVMETLINFIAQKLWIEGFAELSLGEVPFIVDTNNLPIFSKRFVLNRIGKMLKFAYNYEGLFFFKNKFASRWENVYLCAKPAIKISHIIMLSLKSNLLSLTIQKLLR